MEDISQYYARRAAEERQAAVAARSTKAERVHLELADRYSLIAAGAQQTTATED